MAKNISRFSSEGQTPLEDLSGLLVEIKTQTELNDREAKNNTQALAKYLLIKHPEKLNLFSYEVLFQIHKDMFGEVWSWAGEKRMTGKNLGIPPVKIGSEIHRFLSDVRQWKEEGMAPAEIAVRIHHRLVWIHPFENGNGRWARLVTNLYLRQKGLPLLEWPTSEKYIRESFRKKYLNALQSADKGNYQDLSAIHTECIAASA